MNSILEKIDSYQILTNLLPGTFFGLAMKLLYDIDIQSGNFGEAIIVYYFVGLVISRIGSIIIEPLLKNSKFISRADYTEFTQAAKSDPKINVLSEMSCFYRSILSSLLLMLIIWAIKNLPVDLIWLKDNWGSLITFCLMVLFLFSYRKQNEYVYKRIKAINADNKK